jgi:hypothetical protein
MSLIKRLRNRRHSQQSANEAFLALPQWCMACWLASVSRSQGEDPSLARCFASELRVVNLLGIPKQLGPVNTQAAMLDFLTIAILNVSIKVKAYALKVIPGPLVAFVGGTVVSMLLKMDVKRVDLIETFELTKLAPPQHWEPFITVVHTVEIIASIESLHCAVTTDKLHRCVCSVLDKALRAQSAVNPVSRLLGGLSIMGIVVRLEVRGVVCEGAAFSAPQVLSAAKQSLMPNVNAKRGLDVVRRLRAPLNHRRGEETSHDQEHHACS